MLQISTREHDAVLAGEADEANIRAKTDDFPLESTTRMCFAHFYNVTDGYFSKHDAIIHFHLLHPKK